VPTSVLLAVLAAAGLLALAPALVRRYDATERLAAERALSTARVIDRRRRRRSVPGRRPIQLPRALMADLGLGPESVEAEVDRAVWLPVSADRRARLSRPVGAVEPALAVSSPAVRPLVPAPRRARSAPVRVPQSPAIYRRRRVLTALVMLNVIELIGVSTVSSGFWSGFAVTGLLLVWYVFHLRSAAIADARRRRAAARRAAEIAIMQAEIRAEQARRSATRREALRRAAAARSAAQREAVRLSQRYRDYDPTRGARVRGRAYQAGGPGGRVVGL
jgi:hypothetical protein